MDSKIITCKARLIGCNEGVRHALLIPRSSSSPYPVYVCVNLLGSIIVDHALDALDVQSPGRHISRHQHMVLACLVVMQDCHAAVLIHVSMNGSSSAANAMAEKQAALKGTTSSHVEPNPGILQVGKGGGRQGREGAQGRSCAQLLKISIYLCQLCVQVWLVSAQSLYTTCLGHC